jgi:hypothetical protein
LSATVSISSDREDLISDTGTLTGRRVTVAPHAGGDTFSVKTLQTIIETQARWTEDDVRRLKLIR